MAHVHRARTLHRCAFALVVAGLAACGSTAKPSGDTVSTEPIAACTAFTDAFERCQAKLGAPAAAAERVATTRETLHTQTEAAKTESARLALEQQCAAGVKQLAAVCP